MMAYTVFDRHCLHFYHFFLYSHINILFSLDVFYGKKIGCAFIADSCKMIRKSLIQIIPEMSIIWIRLIRLINISNAQIIPCVTWLWLPWPHADCRYELFNWLKYCTFYIMYVCLRTWWFEIYMYSTSIICN